MPVSVVNLRSDPYTVYIGRAGRGQPGPWGNPIRIGHTCPVCNNVHRDAGSTLPCYRTYLDMNPELVAKMRREIPPDAVLGCFCKPGPCHGDVIASIINGDNP